jgi:hypothetical protein
MERNGTKKLATVGGTIMRGSLKPVAQFSVHFANLIAALIFRPVTKHPN